MLQIKNLYKKFGKSMALDGLDLSIHKGELFGFVGPNGAGKTTTMKIIAGLLKADSGEIHVDGIDARKDNKGIKDKIGYVPDFFGVYDNLKVIEYMEFYASLYKITGREARKLCMDMLDLVKLADRSEQYVDHLSRGMKQSLCLARSLVHKPELVILDEPASGLDPRARFQMKEILKNLKDIDKTIIVSSHILPEIAEMCTNVGIINNGKMVVSGTVEEIMDAMKTSNPLVIRIIKNQESGVEILKKHPLADKIVIRDKNVSIVFRGNDEAEAELLASLIKAGTMISSYTREEGNLEALFLKIIGEKEGK